MFFFSNLNENDCEKLEFLFKLTQKIQFEMTHFEFVWGKNHLTFLSAENTKNMIVGQFFLNSLNGQDVRLKSI